MGKNLNSLTDSLIFHWLWQRQRISDLLRIFPDLVNFSFSDFSLTVANLYRNGPARGKRKTMTRVRIEATPFELHRCFTHWATRTIARILRRGKRLSAMTRYKVDYVAMEIVRIPFLLWQQTLPFDDFDFENFLSLTLALGVRPSLQPVSNGWFISTL